MPTPRNAHLDQKRQKAPEPWLPPTDRPARILIVRLSALGDVLHGLPVLTALRARFPEARIDWAVEDRAVDLLRHRGDLDRILPFPRKALSGSLRGIPRPLRLVQTARGFVRHARAGDYDVALDLQGNLKSGAVTRASGAALRFGLGGKDAREGNRWFTQRRFLPPGHVRHRVERNLALASALVGEALPYVAPGFPVSEEDRATAQSLLHGAGASPGSYVVLHPGTSGFGAFKRWPPERFAALARALSSEGAQILITYAPGEEPLAEAIEREADGAATPLATSGLGVLAEVIRSACGFVAADTGPLHLAGLVGTPLLGLFGPKDPAVYGPYGIRRDGTAGLLGVLTQEDVACRPCSLRRCGTPLCMTTMEPARVHQALAGILANATGA